MINVSIIIVNYNSSELTIQAVESIFKHTHEVSFEIIIIDNNSNDNDFLHLKEYNESKTKVKLIVSNENLGFGRANNLGVKSANGEMLFFLNPDTILLNDAVSILFNHLKKNSSVGICGGQLYDNEGNFMHSYSMFLPGIMRDLDTAFKGLLTKLKSNRDKKDYPLKVGYITGADLMIRKNLFNEIKGFDPDFFMYYEESEMTYRIKNLGYKIECCPQARIVHLEGQTHAFNEEKLRMIFTGRLLYMHKTKTPLYFKIADINYKFLNTLNKIQFILRGDKFNAHRVTNKMNVYKDIFSSEKYNEQESNCKS